MQRFIVLISGMAIAAVGAFAAPACVTGSYTSYIALGAGGCTAGYATFSNFSALSFTNIGISALTSDQIQVVPDGTLLAPTLTFIYVNPAGGSAPVTVNQSGQQFAMGFNYLMTLTGAVLSDIQIDSSFANTTPGSASVTKNASLSGGGSFTSTVNDQGVSNAQSNHVGNLVATTGTGVWLISDGTSLQAQVGGSVTQVNFENLFTLTPSVTTGSPETGTILLMGTGLICLGLLFRKRQNVKS
jgi:hypothetical protein